MPKAKTKRTAAAAPAAVPVASPTDLFAAAPASPSHAPLAAALQALGMCRDADALSAPLHALASFVKALRAHTDAAITVDSTEPGFVAVAGLPVALNVFRALGFEPINDGAAQRARPTAVPSEALLDEALEAIDDMVEALPHNISASVATRRVLSSSQISIALVTFSIEYRAAFGSRLFVVGNSFEMGDWSPYAAAPMQAHNGDRWSATLRMPVGAEVSYKYIVVSDDRSFVRWEAGENRSLVVRAGSICVDSWQSEESAHDFLMSRALFKDVVYHRPAPRAARPPRLLGDHVAVTFSVTLATVPPESNVFVVGSSPKLGSWSVADALQLADGAAPVWRGTVTFAPGELTSFEYKYAIVDKDGSVHWEDGFNRLFQLERLRAEHSSDGVGALGEASDARIFHLHDGLFRRASEQWRAAGVVVPVFSLRTSRSVGVGQFTDLKTMVDWCVRCGIKGIQVLPVNDTSIYSTWWDSYPYSSLSVFALHPLYIDLLDLPDVPADVARRIEEARGRLNEGMLDYEASLEFKLEALRQIFVAHTIDAFSALPAVSAFIEEHGWWLMPYALFCVLRDRNGTSNFSTWPEHSTVTADRVRELCKPSSEYYRDVMFHVFVQFHLDRQLVAASHYARDHGVFLKGDLPIGVDPLSVDVWMYPHLFRRQFQTGAPPDYFSRDGQNWGFPTYDWDAMRVEDYHWWRQRLRMMSRYFHAYRIDHILGFFRIWEIPGGCKSGILGHFFPALGLTGGELAEKGIWDLDRMIQPYVRLHLLQRTFGPAQVQLLCDEVFDEYQPMCYRFKAQFSEERQIIAFCDSKPWGVDVQDGLLRLFQNRILLEDPSAAGVFHFRIEMPTTSAFEELDDFVRARLYAMYVDYFFHRQDSFWRDRACEKLPVMVDTTNMLVCGEDLGMIPKCVHSVMDQFRILSLRIQRMPADSSLTFDDIGTYPFMSVCTPSVHDTSSTRGWWEEDREKAQHFYNNVLGEQGAAPFYCETWIMERIIKRHLQSLSMLAMFPLQDLLGLDADLRTPNARDEQINNPAERHHYWRYRMHLPVEQLLASDAFNDNLRGLIERSGRL